MIDIFNAFPSICRLSFVMIMDTKSAIIVVEDDCSGSIDKHSKKDGNGQDPSLWNFFLSQF